MVGWGGLWILLNPLLQEKFAGSIVIITIQRSVGPRDPDYQKMEMEPSLQACQELNTLQWCDAWYQKGGQKRVTQLIQGTKNLCPDVTKQAKAHRIACRLRIDGNPSFVPYEGTMNNLKVPSDVLQKRLAHYTEEEKLYKEARRLQIAQQIAQQIVQKAQSTQTHVRDGLCNICSKTVVTMYDMCPQNTHYVCEQCKDLLLRVFEGYSKCALCDSSEFQAFLSRTAPPNWWSRSG